MKIITSSLYAPLSTCINKSVHKMKNIFLSNADTDDCELFNDAAKELIIQIKLSILENGIALRQHKNKPY